MRAMMKRRLAEDPGLAEIVRSARLTNLGLVLPQIAGMSTLLVDGVMEVAQQWRGLGFRMLAIESDARLLARGAESDARRCRELEAATTSRR